MVRRDSSLRVELGELSSELDLDILGRLEDILQALSHCPSPPQRNTAHAAEVTRNSCLKTITHSSQKKRFGLYQTFHNKIGCDV